MFVSSYARIVGNFDIPKLPLIEVIKPESEIANKVPLSILKAVGYKEFPEELLSFGKIANEEFSILAPPFLKN